MEELPLKINKYFDALNNLIQDLNKDVNLSISEKLNIMMSFGTAILKTVLESTDEDFVKFYHSTMIERVLGLKTTYKEDK